MSPTLMFYIGHWQSHDLDYLKPSHQKLGRF